MQSRRIVDYISEWIGRSVSGGVERELKVPWRRDKVVSIIGPRRAGKTYYFYQLINRDRDGSLYLNFEDTRLYGVDFTGIRDLIRVYVEISGQEPRSIFFDEIQNVYGWEKAIRELLDLQRYNIFVTGSSSKLLSREIATQLRGRTFSYMLLPFSFREYLKAKKVTVPEPLTMDTAAKIKAYLRDYLEYGGFPEVVFEEAEKTRILKEYYEMILFRDIIERHNLKNMNLARFLLSFFLQNFSKEFSINKISKSLGLRGFGKNTLYSYVDKVQDSVALFFLNRYSPKVYQRESWPKKAYLCDTGLAKVAKFSEDIGKLMENVVFLELMRAVNERPILEIHYWKSNQKGEVDFILKEGTQIQELIQVTYARGRDEIDKREIKSLLEASEKTGCKNLTTITWDYEDKTITGNKTIYCIPLWKWLLKNFAVLPQF